MWTCPDCGDLDGDVDITLWRCGHHIVEMLTFHMKQLFLCKVTVQIAKSLQKVVTDKAQVIVALNFSHLLYKPEDKHKSL